MSHVSLVRRALPLALAAAVAYVPTQLAAQQQTGNPFTWTGTVAPQGWLRVRNVNGQMRVEAASGNQVEVVATKRWRRGNPDDVRIEVKRVGPNDGDVLICALWFEDSSCDEQGYHNKSHGDRNDNDVSVDFVVKLPKSTRLDVSTVNGSVRIDGATSEVAARTVNGGIDAVSSGGPVEATTVNGDVNVRMGNSGSEDLRYSTVNGSITVEVPGALDADVEMSTVNGGLSSDYPMTVQGKLNPRHMRATIGKGGRQISFKTVNGSVRLVKR
jgi:hypothetical protein